MNHKEESKIRKNLEHLLRGYFHVEKIDDKKVKELYLSILRNKIIRYEEKQYNVEAFKERYIVYVGRLKWIIKGMG